MRILPDTPFPIPVGATISGRNLRIEGLFDGDTTRAGVDGRLESYEGAFLTEYPRWWD